MAEKCRAEVEDRVGWDGFLLSHSYKFIHMLKNNFKNLNNGGKKPSCAIKISHREQNNSDPQIGFGTLDNAAFCEVANRRKKH